MDATMASDRTFAMCPAKGYLGDDSRSVQLDMKVFLIGCHEIHCDVQTTINHEASTCDVIDGENAQSHYTMTDQGRSVSELVHGCKDSKDKAVTFHGGDHDGPGQG